MEYFTEQVIRFIAAIPPGKVVAYGQVAAACGKPRAARQVARILRTYSAKLDLPWQRVINSRGQISLGKNGGYEEQKARLLSEGIIFDKNDKIDWQKFGWRPDL
jgi:methylated-DNA-protein-cysteine methyltransferase-like protein